MRLTVNEISLHQDEKGWWVLSELFEGGPPMHFLFWDTAWVCFKARVEEVVLNLEGKSGVRFTGSSATVQ